MKINPAAEDELDQRSRAAVASRLMQAFGREGAARAFKEATGHATFDAARQAGLTREAIAEAVTAHIDQHARAAPAMPPPDVPPPARGGWGADQVWDRVAAFRKAHPGAAIETEVAHLDDEVCVIRARIVLDDGRILATGHGRATRATSAQYKGRYVEKAETAAVGRALGFAGYGKRGT